MGNAKFQLMLHHSALVSRYLPG